MKFSYKRILIIGCGGAGKSTLAQKIGKAFSIPVIHLDKLYWLPGWVHRTNEDFECLLEIELKKSAWIIDGNYQRTFAERLLYADFCIFLDIDTEICLKSAYARAEEYHGRTRPDMTEGCEEIVRPDFEDWIRHYQENARPEMMRILEKSKVPYQIFTTRQESEQWIKELQSV